MLEISKKRRKSSVVSLASLFMEGGWGFGFKCFTLWKAVFISGLICTVFGALDQEKNFRDKNLNYVGEITNERTNSIELWFGRVETNYLATISSNFGREGREIAEMAVEAVKVVRVIGERDGGSGDDLMLLGKWIGTYQVAGGNRGSLEGDCDSTSKLRNGDEGVISAGLS